MEVPSLQPFRQLRRATGLSLRVVSERTKINRGRLSIIERGVMPTPDEARRIVEVLSRPVPSGIAEPPNDDGVTPIGGPAGVRTDAAAR